MKNSFFFRFSLWCDLSKVFNMLIKFFVFFYKYVGIAGSLFVNLKGNRVYFLSKVFYLTFFFFVFFFFVYGFELFEEFIVSLGLTIFLIFIFFFFYFKINDLLMPFKVVIKMKFVDLLLQLAIMSKNIINYFVGELRSWKIYYQLFLEEEKIVLVACNTKWISVYNNKNFVSYKVLLFLNQLVNFYNLWFLDIFFFNRYLFFFFSRLHFFYRVKIDMITEEQLADDIRFYLI